MLESVLRDFRAESEAENEVLKQLQIFIARFGVVALGNEVVGEIGHITANAWIVNSNAQVLLVFGRKEGAWKLPGAHCEGTLIQTVSDEAARALGHAPATQNPPLWALDEREIAEYWNTPTHRHFELIFRFKEVEAAALPPGAKWFSHQEIALLGDASLARLLQKNSTLSG